MFRIESNNLPSMNATGLFWRKPQRHRRRPDLKHNDKGYESEASEMLTEKFQKRDVLLKKTAMGKINIICLSILWYK